MDRPYPHYPPTPLPGHTKSRTPYLPPMNLEALRAACRTGWEGKEPFQNGRGDWKGGLEVDDEGYGRGGGLVGRGVGDGRFQDPGYDEYRYRRQPRSAPYDYDPSYEPLLNHTFHLSPRTTHPRFSPSGSRGLMSPYKRVRRDYHQHIGHGGDGDNGYPSAYYHQPQDHHHNYRYQTHNDLQPPYAAHPAYEDLDVYYGVRYRKPAGRRGVDPAYHGYDYDEGYGVGEWRGGRGDGEMVAGGSFWDGDIMPYHPGGREIPAYSMNQHYAEEGGSEGPPSLQRKYLADYRLQEDPVEQYSVPLTATRPVAKLPKGRSSVSAVEIGGRGGHGRQKRRADEGKTGASTGNNIAPVLGRGINARHKVAVDQPEEGSDGSAGVEEEDEKEEEQEEEAMTYGEEVGESVDDIPTDGLVRVKYYGSCTTCSANSYHCLPGRNLGTCKQCEKKGSLDCDLIEDESENEPAEGWLRPLPCKLNGKTAYVIRELNTIALYGHKAKNPCTHCRKTYAGDAYPCWMAADGKRCHTCYWKRVVCEPGYAPRRSPVKPTRAASVVSQAVEIMEAAGDLVDEKAEEEEEDLGNGQEVETNHQRQKREAPATLSTYWGPGWVKILKPYIADPQTSTVAISLARLAKNGVKLEVLKEGLKYLQCEKLGAKQFRQWSASDFKVWVEQRKREGR